MSLQVREERKAIRPKNHSEQVLLLRSLIDEASELPPIPLSPAYQRRWALEFEGQSLKTYRRLPEDSRCRSVHDFQHNRTYHSQSCCHAALQDSFSGTLSVASVLSLSPDLHSAVRLTGHLQSLILVTVRVLMLEVRSTDNFSFDLKMVAQVEPDSGADVVKHCASASLLPWTHEPSERNAIRRSFAETAPVHAGILCSAMARYGARSTK